jgi:hypothetical protein
VDAGEKPLQPGEIRLPFTLHQRSRRLRYTAGPPEPLPTSRTWLSAFT